MLKAVLLTSAPFHFEDIVGLLVFDPMIPLIFPGTSPFHSINAALLTPRAWLPPFSVAF